MSFRPLRETALIGLPIVTFALTCLAAIWKEGWLFVVIALIGWSVADIAMRTFDIGAVVNVKGYLVYILAVAIATGAAVWLTGLLFENVPTATNATLTANGIVQAVTTPSDWLASVLFVNLVTAGLVFLDSRTELTSSV